MKKKTLYRFQGMHNIILDNIIIIINNDFVSQINRLRQYVNHVIHVNRVKKKEKIKKMKKKIKFNQYLQSTYISSSLNRKCEKDFRFVYSDFIM